MNKDIIKLVNDASNKNLEISLLYKSIKNWTNFEGWEGFANLFDKQSSYNLRDSNKIEGFLNDLGYKATIEKLEKPREDFEDLEEILELYYNKEAGLIDIYSKVVESSRKEEFYEVEIYFKNMISSQMRVLSYIEPLVTRIKRVGKSTDGLYILNGELKNF